MELAARWTWALSARLWAGWAAVLVALTFEPLRWHVEYFRSPGPGYHRAILFVLPALAAACYGFCRLRARRSMRALEPLGLALLVAVPSLVYEPRGALTAALLLAGAAAWGSAVVEPDEHGLASALYAIGAGLGLLILLLLALGLAGWYRWEVFAVLLVAPIFLLRARLVELARGLWEAAGRWPDDPGAAAPLAGASVFFAGIFLVIAAMLTLAPAIAHDALLMHLAAVRQYAAAGSLAPLPFQSYSYYPQGAETLMTAAYALGGQAAVQFVNPLFFALALGSVVCIGRRIGLSRAACALAAAALLAVPFLLWDGSVIKNDLAATAFQLLAISCAFGGRDGKLERRLRLGVFLLASSLAIKYTALFGLPSIALLLLYQLRERPGRMREAAVWAAIFAAVAFGWSARAYALTGNPLFPADFSRMVGRVAPSLGSGEGWRGVSYLEIPWYVHFTGHRAFESPSENPLGFFLLLSLPAWLLLRRRRVNAKVVALLLLSGCYYLLWGSVFPFLRYAIPPLALVFLLASERLESLYRQSGGRLRAAVWGMTVYNFLFCLLPAMILSVNGPQLALFAGRIDKAEYLRRALAPFGAIEFLQSAAEPCQLVLGAWVTTAGYAPDPAAFNPRYFRPADGPAAVQTELAAWPYRFLVAPDTPEGRRAGSETPPGYESWLAYEDGRYVVYRLEPPDAPPPAPCPGTGEYDTLR